MWVWAPGRPGAGAQRTLGTADVGRGPGVGRQLPGREFFPAPPVTPASSHPVPCRWSLQSSPRTCSTGSPTTRPAASCFVPRAGSAAPPRTSDCPLRPLGCTGLAPAEGASRPTLPLTCSAPQFQLSGQGVVRALSLVRGLQEPWAESTARLHSCGLGAQCPGPCKNGLYQSPGPNCGLANPP